MFMLLLFKFLILFHYNMIDNKLKVMKALADSRRFLTEKEIAKKSHTPINYVKKILMDLRRTNLIIWHPIKARKKAHELIKEFYIKGHRPTSLYKETEFHYKVNVRYKNEFLNLIKELEK